MTAASSPWIESFDATIAFDGKRLSAVGLRATAPPDARVLVFLHGALSSHQGLIPLLDRMIARDALLIDLPGHGSSSMARKDDIDAFAQAVSLAAQKAFPDRPYVYVGESLGALVALRIADRSPNSVVAVIAGDPPLGGCANASVRLAYRYIEGVRGRLPANATGLASGVFGFDTTTYAGAGFDHWPVLEDLAPPVRVLALSGDLTGDPAEELTRSGRLPRIFGPEEAARARRMLGERFEWHEIAGSDHLVFRNYPANAAAAIETFLAGL